MLNKFTIICLIAISLTAHAAIKTSASSVLNNSSSYSHKNCIDGNVHSAWAEGSASDGTGEWIKLDFGPDTMVQYLGIIPGYNKYTSGGRDLWTANNRVSRIRLEFSDGTSMLIPLFYVKAIQYAKVMKKTSFIKITIDSVIAGTDYNDACISEILPVFNGKPEYNDSWCSPSYSGDKDDVILLKYFYEYLLPPVIITFLNKTHSLCGGYMEQFHKINDSTFYNDDEYLRVGPDAQFTLSSPTATIVEVLQSYEYRWASGGSSSESPCFYNEYFPSVDSGSYFTDWKKINPEKERYTLFKMAKPASNDAFTVKPIIAEKEFIHYFDSLGFDKLYEDYGIGERMELLKYATRLKIRYLENGKAKNVVIILLDMYGPC